MGSTVLLPVRNNARWARNVAEVVAEFEDDGTETVILHVFDDDEVVSTRANLDDGDALSVDDLAARKSGVGAAAEVLTDGGLDPTPRGVREDDRTADAILDATESADADRVYLYARKRSPAGKAVFGSTVQRVVLNARVPVTVVPSRAV
jgi:nucleotide-binding universal stress UspA family protein